jgi:hypothetical protein
MTFFLSLRQSRIKKPGLCSDRLAVLTNKKPGTLNSIGYVVAKVGESWLYLLDLEKGE